MPLRRRAGDGRRPLTPPRVTGQAPVQAHLTAARLRLAARISVQGTPAIRGLAQSWSGAGWRRALGRDMQLMQRTLGSKLGGLLDLALSPSAWEAFWGAHPGAWALLISKFVARSAHFPRGHHGGPAAG